MLQRASPRTGGGSQGDSVASALPKNYFCLPLPPPLPNFFSFSSPSIQLSHPSSFPKVSFNSSPAVPFTSCPSPHSSIFPSSRFYPLLPLPHPTLPSVEAHKLLQYKKSPQIWSPRYALGVAFRHRAPLLTSFRSGRYQRFRSYWPHCKLLSYPPSLSDRGSLVSLS